MTTIYESFIYDKKKIIYRYHQNTICHGRDVLKYIVKLFTTVKLRRYFSNINVYFISIYRFGLYWKTSFA